MKKSGKVRIFLGAGCCEPCLLNFVARIHVFSPATKAVSMVIHHLNQANEQLEITHGDDWRIPAVIHEMCLGGAWGLVWAEILIGKFK